jgi:transposase
MAMGKRKRHAKQVSMWVATHDLPRSAAHPFYARLNEILDQHDFDGFVEGLCERFYAREGRPGLPPGRYFRLLLIGYFEGLDAERAIAWRAADSFAVREFLGLVLPEGPPRDGRGREMGRDLGMQFGLVATFRDSNEH